MHLLCPVCEAQYDLEGVTIGPRGRRVRCGSCGHVWRVFEPETPVPVEDDADVPVSPRQEAGAEPSGAAAPHGAEMPFAESPLPPVVDIPEMVKPRSTRPKAAEAAGEVLPRRALAAGLSTGQVAAGTFFVLLSALLAVLLVFSAQLVRAAPALAPVYRALGVDAAPRGDGLAFSALKAERRVEQARQVLQVEAELRNASPSARPTPALEVLARDRDGAVVKSWQLPAPDERTLASGETTPVRVTFTDAPPEAVHLEIKVKDK